MRRWLRCCPPPRHTSRQTKRADDKQPGRRGGISSVIASVYPGRADGDYHQYKLKTNKGCRGETEGKDLDLLCSDLWTADP